MLLGRLFVGIGLGLGPPVASLYVTEVCSIFVSLILDFFFFFPLVDVRTCFFLIWSCPICASRFLLPLWGVPTEALFKLQHVLDLWGPYLLESLQKILPAGKIRTLDSSASVFLVWQFDVLINCMCSGGVSVFGYLQFHLQYLLLPWCFVQKVPIGYTRFVFIYFPCPKMIIIIIF